MKTLITIFRIIFIITILLGFYYVNIVTDIEELRSGYEGLLVTLFLTNMFSWILIGKAER